MMCKRCDRIIDMYRPPFGAYFCKKDHVQCEACELISSNCVKCGGETKYKSPHFISEKDSVETEVENGLEIPIITEIEPTKEEEKEFKRLRKSFIDGERKNNIKFLRNRNDLHAVRTLSAIIMNDVYAKNCNSARKTESPVRFQRIMKALRESGCPTEQTENNSDSEDLDETKKECSARIDPDEPDELELLYPQSSRLDRSSMKLAMSMSVTRTSSLCKICSRSDVMPEQEASEHTIYTESDSDILNLGNFKTVSRLNLVENPPENFPISLDAESLDHLPFECPISQCLGKFFVSDCTKHIVQDHPTIPLAHLRFGQFKELFIDVNLCSFTPYTVACFLLNNIVKDFVNPPLHDILPMLLMAARFRFNMNAATSSNDESSGIDESWSEEDFLVIWLSGIVPESVDISVMISTFSDTDLSLSRWLVNSLNPIQDTSTVENVFREAKRMVLTFREVQALTNKFENQLHCQIGLVNYGLVSPLKTSEQGL